MSLNEEELFNSSVVSHKTLIVCRGNTCRSILYESLLKNKKKANREYFSAGINVQQENIEEDTIKILNKNNIPISKYTPTDIDVYRDKYFDEVIILDKDINITSLDLNFKLAKRIIFKDPYGLSALIYENLFNKIRKSISSMSHWIGL